MKQTEKLDIILKKLYDYRYDGQYYKIDLIFSEKKIEYQGEETFILAKRLEDDGLVQRAGNISTSVRLTSHGIDYCENDSYTYSGSSVMTNNYNLTISNSPNAILNNQSPNSIFITGDLNKLSTTIDQIRETILNDESIGKEKKLDIQHSLTQITNELKEGELKKESVKKFLDKTSKISSIGSFLLNLMRLIIGV